MVLQPLFPQPFSKAARQTIIRYFRALLFLLNLRALFLAGLGCLAVYCCDRWGLQFNMDFTLVATGTTFPLVFTIQQSFTRREKALTLIANLKASAVGLYFMHRDWCQDEGFPTSMGNDHNTAALQCKLLLVDLLRDVRAYLLAQSPYGSYSEQRLSAKRHECANLLLADMSLSGASQLSFAVALEKAEKEDPATSALRRCYRCFSRLSVLNEKLGLRAGYQRGGEGGMSRTNQYLRYMISNLEELRYIREYRTPIMMRAAHGVLLHLFAVILAPYFVHFCDSWQWSRDSCPAGYTASIVYCLITMLLFNTQQDLENPFDMQGMDDVFFVMDREMDDCWQPLASMAATPSGYASPRHFGQEACSSPCPRSHPDLCWPPPAPWAQQKVAAAVSGAASISRRGSTLGTVTEEEALIGTAPIDGHTADDGTAASSGPDVAAPLSVASCEQQGAAASQDGGAGASPHMLLGARDLHISMPPHGSTQSLSPLASPRHSGCGTSSGLRPPAAPPVAAFAAGFSSLRHRSPFDKPTSPMGNSQQGQREQELAGKQNKQVLRRRSSGSSSQEEEFSSAGGRGSAGSIESAGDSRTSLIREGVCRSDMG